MLQVPAIVALVVFLVSAGVSQATPILDQSFTPNVDTSYGISNQHSRGQTFTVGLTGTLSSIDFYIRNNGVSDLALWDIRATTGGVPTASDSTTLASGSFASNLAPSSLGFFSIDVSSFGIAVAPGDVLALDLRGTGANTALGWGGQTTNAYATGSGFNGAPGSVSTTWNSLGNTDLGFQTFVEPVSASSESASSDPVPEPSAMALSLVGGLAMFSLRFRMQRAANKVR
jgi:hypothetical protein